MPKYIEAYGQTIEFPDDMADDAIAAAIKRGSMDIPRPKGQGGTAIGNALMGMGRGIKDVLDTGADYLSRLGPAGENERVQAMNAQGKADFDAQYGGSTAASLGRVGGNIAATLPVGGAVGYGLRAAAPLFGAAAPAAASLGNAIATGGMTTGNTLPAIGNMAARVAGGGISGGLSAGLVDPSSASTGAAIGAALPAATRVAGMAGNALRNQITGGGVAPEVAQLAARAKELGINVPADRLVDSRPLNALAASLNYVPFSGRSATEDAMSAQLNKALAGTIGQDTPNISKALDSARAQLGGEFDRVLRNNPIRVDRQFLDDLAASASRANEELPAEGAAIINRQVDNIINKAVDGSIDGQAAYNIKRTLDNIGKQATRPEAHYASDLRKTLMGGLNRSLGPEEAAKFATTRRQYGTMLDLDRIVPNGAETAISAAKIGNMRNINDPAVQEVADIAAQFIRPRESAHGAMQRVVLGSGAVAGGMLGGGLLGGAAGLGAMVGAGRATNSLLNSEAARSYLLNQGLLAQPSAAGGLLGSGLYRSAPLLGVD